LYFYALCLEKKIERGWLALKMAEIEFENLFNHAMRGQWREVLESYEKTPEVLEAKITKAEDTVLHIASLN
jgi:hypothetical protein